LRGRLTPRGVTTPFGRTGVGWGGASTAEEAEMDMKSDVRQTIEGARDVISVQRVFGDPYEKNGVTVIPAARVQGGAGRGGGDGPAGEGAGIGAGFGVNARPAGAFVIRGEDVDWRPAIDVNRVILGGQLNAVAALLLARAVVKSRAGRG